MTTTTSNQNNGDFSLPKSPPFSPPVSSRLAQFGEAEDPERSRRPRRGSGKLGLVNDDFLPRNLRNHDPNNDPILAKLHAYF